MKDKSIFIFLTLLIFSVSKTDVNSDEIIFSKESGFYDSEFKLTLSSEDESPIFYTVDASDPTNSNTSMEYKEPILIQDRTNEPNLYSEYEEDDNSDISVCLGGHYKKPKFQVDKAMVIRAVKKTSEGFGSTIDKIYFVTNKDLAQYEEYTVASLVTNPENLFDPEKGIYVTGKQYLDYKNGPNYDPGKNVWSSNDYPCNYYGKGKEWEREASFYLFEKKELSIKQNIGIRIKGAATRNVQHKSFNLYAKEKYGKKLFESSTLFPDNVDINGKPINKYKTFALRSIYDEYRLNDKLAHILIRDREQHLHIDNKNAILFLNGEYWGLYTMIESTSAVTLSNHYNILKDDIVLIKEGEVENGEPDNEGIFGGYVWTYYNKDLSIEQNYKDAEKIFDLDSILEHFATGIYFEVNDWPNYNYGVWKYKGEKIEGNRFSDGRWRFLSFDFDVSMGRVGVNYGGVEGYAFDSFKHVEERKGSVTSLFLALLKNTVFRNKFVNVICDYANDVAKSEKVDEILDEFRETLAEQVGNSLARWWGYNSNNKANEIEPRVKKYAGQQIDLLKTYFRERGRYLIDHMKAYFNLQSSNLKELTVKKEGNGKIQINSIIPEFNEGTWKGEYFDNIPVILTAIPSEKSTFKGWAGDIESTNKTISISLSKENSVKAIFED